MIADLDRILKRSAARHDHLCPRQVLGARMGLAGLASLGLEPSLTKTTGLVIVETDGCFVDGLEAATGATLGHRTLMVRDLGKLAATFVDVASEEAIRFAVRPDSRHSALGECPTADDRYAAQLQGYRVMSDEELFTTAHVVLEPSLASLLSTPEVRVVCGRCGEEIINGREIVARGTALCKTCAGDSYYQLPDQERTLRDLVVNR